jgi:hypothetical protein
MLGTLHLHGDLVARWTRIHKVAGSNPGVTANKFRHFSLPSYIVSYVWWLLENVGLDIYGPLLSYSLGLETSLIIMLHLHANLSKPWLQQQQKTTKTKKT